MDDKAMRDPALPCAHETPALMEMDPRLGQMVAEFMRPIMGTIAELLKNNAEAMERIAATQSIQNDRMEALEKQIRLQTPVTGKQVSYLNEAIRGRARELLDKRQLANDRRAVTRLGNAIRRDVLARYGAGSLREIPRHEYSVALNQIGGWSNLLLIRDVTEEARKREQALEPVEPTAGVDGKAPPPRQDHQPGEPQMH